MRAVQRSAPSGRRLPGERSGERCRTDRGGTRSLGRLEQSRPPPNNFLAAQPSPALNKSPWVAAYLVRPVSLRECRSCAGGAEVAGAGGAAADAHGRAGRWVVPKAAAVWTAWVVGVSPSGAQPHHQDAMSVPIQQHWCLLQREAGGTCRLAMWVGQCPWFVWHHQDRHVCVAPPYATVWCSCVCRPDAGSAGPGEPDAPAGAAHGRCGQHAWMQT